MYRSFLHRFSDFAAFRRILHIQNKHKKEFFCCGGCGLEIEFGVIYAHESARYIRTGLEKLRLCVGSDGKFVTDNTVGCDFNVEIVLDPLPEDKLEEKFKNICSILSYCENFVFSEKCGVHANFYGDEQLKRAFYDRLIDGGYKTEMFIHNKYKTDFLAVARRADGSFMDYDEYLLYQHTVSAKYTSVNFLKPSLIEFRALDLSWEKISYVIELYEDVSRETCVSA